MLAGLHKPAVAQWPWTLSSPHLPLITLAASVTVSLFLFFCLCVCVCLSLSLGQFLYFVAREVTPTTTESPNGCFSLTETPCKKLKSDSDRISKAWEHWRKLGEPKFIVAPMVDQSELPFRMLCRKYGATAAYTPMLHSRLFVEDPKYRSNEFTTCPVSVTCALLGQTSL